MSGTVNIARDLWDDPVFTDAEMSQREAWIWLIAEASWKPRVKRFAGRDVSLGRGQVAASTRFMAAAWMWSEPRVRRYLDMLENRRMITRATDAGVTVITICKYDDYQSQPRDGGAATTQEQTHDRRTADANEKKGEIRFKKEEEGAGASPDFQEDQSEIPEAPPSPSAPTPTAPPDPTPAIPPGLLDDLRQAVGVQPHDAGPYWSDPTLRGYVAAWMALGLTPDRIVAEAKASRAKNPDPPDGPKALERWMQTAARAVPDQAKPQAQRAQVKPPASPEDRLNFFAAWVNGDKPLPPSAVTTSMAQALIHAGLVTVGRMRERGIAA